MAKKIFNPAPPPPKKQTATGEILSDFSFDPGPRICGLNYKNDPSVKIVGTLYIDGKPVSLDEFLKEEITMGKKVSNPAPPESRPENVLPPPMRPLGGLRMDKKKPDADGPSLEEFRRDFKTLSEIKSEFGDVLEARPDETMVAILEELKMLNGHLEQISNSLLVCSGRKKLPYPRDVQTLDE